MIFRKRKDCEIVSREDQALIERLRSEYGLDLPSDTYVLYSVCFRLHRSGWRWCLFSPTQFYVSNLGSHRSTKDILKDTKIYFKKNDDLFEIV
jgi:hypothetical protein